MLLPPNFEFDLSAGEGGWVGTTAIHQAEGEFGLRSFEDEVGAAENVLRFTWREISWWKTQQQNTH
jgi:hypothetical protein